MGAAVEALSEAPDRVQEFRFGPNWQRGLTVAAQATARIVGAVAIH